MIEPDDGLCAVGSGGVCSRCRSRDDEAFEIGHQGSGNEAMRIASEICIYTNANFTVEEL